MFRNKEILIRLIILVLALVVTGCNDSDYNNTGQVEDPNTSLYGTWVSGKPAALGWSGRTWHSYHTDGTLTSHVSVVDPESGCRFIYYYIGQFDATADTSGTTETAHCTDESMVEAERQLSADELAIARHEDTPIIIEGDMLTFTESGATHTRFHGHDASSVDDSLSHLIGRQSRSLHDLYKQKIWVGAGERGIRIMQMEPSLVR